MKQLKKYVSSVSSLLKINKELIDIPGLAQEISDLLAWPTKYLFSILSFIRSINEIPQEQFKKRMLSFFFSSYLANSLIYLKAIVKDSTICVYWASLLEEKINSEPLLFVSDRKNEEKQEKKEREEKQEEKEKK